MVKQMYPKLTVNLQYFKENVAAMVEKCNACGIEIAGVIKGTTGFPQCAQMFKEGGAKIIASSRLEQIEDTIEYGVGLRKNFGDKFTGYGEAVFRNVGRTGVTLQGGFVYKF